MTEDIRGLCSLSFDFQDSRQCLFRIMDLPSKYKQVNFYGKSEHYQYSIIVLLCL